jgi:serine-type D-Ala-D-Ala carboxypeptidase (penicillin-binding protein 5/6)
VKARASFVGAAERDGRRLVVTLLKADPRVWAEAASLLDWGFAASAAGLPPVGELVDPVVPEQPADGGDRARATFASTERPTAPAEGSTLPLAASAAGAVLLSGLVARRRTRRRSRGRYRLDLPL